jgi:hypothetical protein
MVNECKKYDSSSFIFNDNAFSICSMKISSLPDNSQTPHPLLSVVSKRLYSESLSDLGCGDQQVEVCILTATQQVGVMLLFENFPVWSLGLEPTKVRHIHIMGYDTQLQLMDSLTARGAAINVLQRLLFRFGPYRISYYGTRDAHPKFGGTMLVSGSLHYIHSVVSSGSGSGSFWMFGMLDHHFYGRLRNGHLSGLTVGTFKDQFSRREFDIIQLVELLTLLLWSALRHMLILPYRFWIGLCFILLIMGFVLYASGSQMHDLKKHKHSRTGSIRPIWAGKSCIQLTSVVLDGAIGV